MASAPIFIEAPAVGPVLDACYTKVEGRHGLLCEFEHGVLEFFETNGDVIVSEVLGVDRRYLWGHIFDIKRRTSEARHNQAMYGLEARRAEYQAKSRRLGLS